MVFMGTFREIVIELGLRVFLLSIYLLGEVIAPFTRVIQPEEVWLYRNPQTDSYIQMSTLWVLAIVVPLSAVALHFFSSNNRRDLIEALWCFSLIISLNGAITNSVKVMVGRPRPDFVFRCSPDGNFLPGEVCTGSAHTVNDGRKSFPSGHSSVAFASFGFLSLYLAGKLKTFTIRHKGSAGRLLAVLLPLFFSMCVAISRTCDYHHHWQDVFVGSLLGMSVCSLCYFHFYPSLTDENCDIPWRQHNQPKRTETTGVKQI